MAHRDILSVGFEYPGVGTSYVPWLSKRSRLDGDIILFQPQLDYTVDYLHPTYNGKPSLNEETSASNRAQLKHWRDQLLLAVDGGKTIFVFLSAPEQVFALTGQVERSGTGRSQRVTQIVSEITSYDALPITFESLISALGGKTRVTKDGALIAAYWKIMSELSKYEAHFNYPKGKSLLMAGNGTATIASLLRGKNGSFVLLPALEFPKDRFTSYNEKERKSFWTKEALKYGKMFVAAIIEIDRSLHHGAARSPAPAWIGDKQYILAAERETEAGIASTKASIEKLQQDHADLQKQIA
jgi:hypothetical protein